MTDEPKIREIDVWYNNGDRLIINQFELDKIEKLGEALTWLERAKAVFEQLKPLFIKAKQ